jgi:anti-sigma B factor antagonist
MDLKKSQTANGIPVLILEGSIYMGDDCRRMEKELEDLIAANQPRVILDFTGVMYLDSSGIGTLVKSLSKLKKAGGSMRLAGVQGMVEGVLKLTRVNTVIGLYPNVAAASEDFAPAGGN